MGHLSRWSALAFLCPERFVEAGQWVDFDLRTWSREEYKWRGEGWTPWNDTVQRPSETVLSGRGDCDDYAFVAASWALARDRPGVGIAVMGHYVGGVVPRPTHMVAYDDAPTVYSSGSIYDDMTVREYVDRFEDYDWYLARSV